MQELHLSWLESGEMPGLSKRAGGNLLEACLVCLESNGHQPRDNLSVDVGDVSEWYRLIWTGIVGQQALRAYADQQEATEWGACGVACILINRLTGLVVTSRSRKGTKFDYWLGSETNVDSNHPQMFQDMARLEVSGIFSDEKMSVINRRVKEKIQQIKEGEQPDLPAYVVVVEFGRPLAKVKLLEGPDESKRTA